MYNALPALPGSCVASSRVLLEKRDLYERDGIFQPSVIEYVAAALASEEDEKLNSYLAGLPDESRISETRKVMHRDLHRH